MHKIVKPLFLSVFFAPLLLNCGAPSHLAAINPLVGKRMTNLYPQRQGDQEIKIAHHSTRWKVGDKVQIRRWYSSYQAHESCGEGKLQNECEKLQDECEGFSWIKGTVASIDGPNLKVAVIKAPASSPTGLHSAYHETIGPTVDTFDHNFKGRYSDSDLDEILKPKNTEEAYDYLISNEIRNLTLGDTPLPMIEPGEWDKFCR
ncbi:MAG: hypothetical protein VYA34_02235 [Myxococcota bacterium]|nr:hypothetical protein [Myxococcota bacterium]